MSNLVKIKVTLSSEDGEVFEHFWVERPPTPVVNTPETLAAAVRSDIEQVFETKDVGV